ncbi:MAG TPA: hypothetical protein VHP38_02645, partial [Ruminiclostridium sp.]|nr:hypothetical protein [Ruminiclostridium sp.]
MKEENVLELPAVDAGKQKINKSNRESKIDSELYWKKPSVIWPILQIAAFIAALIVSISFQTKQMVDLIPYRIFLALVIGFFTIRSICSLFNSRIKAVNDHQAQFYFAVGLILI